MMKQLAKYTKALGALSLLSASLCSYRACGYRDLPELSSRDLAYFIKRLSGNEYEGREAGLPGARRAADFLVSYYRRHGFPPAFDRSYRQPFSFDAGMQIGKENQLTWYLPQEGSKDAASASRANATDNATDNETDNATDNETDNETVDRAIAETTFLPLPFSPPQEVEAELLFCGFCIDAGERWNDLARRDVRRDLKKRIALCLRHGPGGRDNSSLRRQISFRYKYNRLKEAGASAVIFLGRQGYDPPAVEEMGVSTRSGPPAVFAEPELFFRHFPWLKEVEKRLLEGKPSPEVGTRMGRIHIKTDFQKRSRTGYNVGAWLKPPQAGEKIIVLGAHYDHLGYGAFGSLAGADEIHNGADDNASGTAAVMEIARAAQALLASPDRQAAQGRQQAQALQTPLTPQEVYQPAMKNLLFLHFDAEERGLLGSRAFLEREGKGKFKIEAMINLDMVGRLRPEKGLTVQGADSADSNWREILEVAFAESGFDKEIRLHFIPGGSGPSDHSSFYRKGIPVAFFFTGAHRQYHRPEDDFELINLEGLLVITRMNLSIVQQLLLPQVSLTYRKAPTAVGRKAFEFGVRLGIVPGNYGSGDGVEVSEVFSDAPVASTGLQSGDVIVQLGNRQIDNINDLTEFLSDATTRKSYRLSYRRGKRLIHTKTRLISTQ